MFCESVAEYGLSGGEKRADDAADSRKSGGWKVCADRLSSNSGLFQQLAFHYQPDLPSLYKTW